ncbi:MAG: hypothetical protein O8C64_05805 [Candidatus Methanoperedens sp.]|nr:hypothetical protein [Candidatus Methanoperedens sp.]MCZ7405297.1 hypothetical protein [Candidatus Methanoperedens sp.]
MKSMLIANVGNSDLGTGEQAYFSKGIHNIYEESKKFCDDKYFKFDAILLEPMIKELIKEYEIEGIYLLATEQRPIHQQDTIYIARIIKEILYKKFEIKSIEIIQIHENPSDYDEMFNLYEREIRKIAPDADVIHISITGGTPGQNMALLTRSLMIFGKKVQIIYKPKGIKETKRLKIGEEITKILLSERLKALKERHLYGVAAELAEESNILSQKEVYRLRALEHKSLFDFEECVNDLERVFDTASGEEKARIKKEIEEIKRLHEGLKNKKPFSEEYFLTYKALIRELCENMKIKLDQSAYTDFLGRLFRFEEAILRYAFEKETNIITERIKGGFEDFEKYIKSDKDLLSFLEGEGIKLEYIDPNRRILRKIIEFWVTKRGIKKWGQVFGFVNRINKPEGNSLADLRNKSILAHGFEGISKNDFENYGDILRDIDRISLSLKDSNTV